MATKDGTSSPKRASDLAAERWLEEYGSAMPEAIVNRWRGYERAHDRETLLGCVALLPKGRLGNPIHTMDEVELVAWARSEGLSATDLLAARAWIAKNGRPTGVMFRRGTHGGNYVEHPLGLDAAPGWMNGVKRPNLVEVAAALKVDNAVSP